MKKEKTIRTYQRRTKSGKVVTVRQHTASYDAAEKLQELAKKKGAGKEFEDRKSKGMPDPSLPLEQYLDELSKRKKGSEAEDSADVSKEAKKGAEKKTTKKEPTPKKKSAEKSTKRTKAETSEPAFTAAEFKEWYHGTGSAADKKVAKALRAQLGRAGYRKFEDEAIDNYSSRGHLSMFKRVSGGSEVNEPKKGAAKTTKDIARGSKEKATEAKSSKAKESKSVKAPKNESQGQREARWNRGEFTADEKATAIMVYDLSGSKNNLHPKLSAWAKKEIKRMDDERAAKVDTKILKGLNRDVVSKLATLQGKKKLSKEDEDFIDKHVAPSGLIRGTKVSAFDAISAHKKDVTSSKSSGTYNVSYRGADGKTHVETFSDKESADDFRRNVAAGGSRPRGMFLPGKAEPKAKKETGGKPIDDPIKRARLIEVLRNKGKGEFDRVQMIHDFKEYFSRKGGWTPSAKGKALLKEAKGEFDSLKVSKTSKKRFKDASDKPSSAKEPTSTKATRPVKKARVSSYNADIKKAESDWMSGSGHAKKLAWDKLIYHIAQKQLSGFKLTQKQAYYYGLDKAGRQR